MWFNTTLPAPPTLEELRKRSRILVIDDQEFPFLGLFKRDTYSIERWPEVENLQKLTDGFFDVILLDIHGVGLVESPRRQGLGIMEHIKNVNPAQAVILYSSKPQSITNRNVLLLADEVLDKSAEYLEYKQAVDQLLLRRYSAEYFIFVMNRELGDAAALTPKAVPRALRALRTGKTEPLRGYLSRSLRDDQRIDRIINVIGTGAAVLQAISS